MILYGYIYVNGFLEKVLDSKCILTESDEMLLLCGR